MLTLWSLIGSVTLIWFGLISGESHSGTEWDFQDKLASPLLISGIVIDEIHWYAAEMDDTDLCNVLTKCFSIHSLMVDEPIYTVWGFFYIQPSLCFFYVIQLLHHSRLTQQLWLYFWSFIKLSIWGEITQHTESLPRAIILYAFHSHSIVHFKKKSNIVGYFMSDCRKKENGNICNKWVNFRAAHFYRSYNFVPSFQIRLKMIRCSQ